MTDRSPPRAPVTVPGTGFEMVLVPALNDNYVYLVRDPDTGTVAVVDPGEAAPVIAALDARGWRPSIVFNTHHHPDHVGGNQALKDRYGARVVGPAADAHRIATLDEPVADGDPVRVGAIAGRVVETPGHTSGHIALVFEDARALFCGDTLFALGCGRLFEGTPEQMWASLSRFADLPDDMAVCCAHEYTAANARFALTVEPDNAALRTRAAEVAAAAEAGRPTVPSTLGAERATNPFLRADRPELAAAQGLEGAPAAAVFAAVRAAKDRF
ncbi:hydroxyacylglutathione hydrolase [Rhodothalassium salexigens DSM 2132]|uniref:Hydroxyacylglutathione hydrolase n=1 Tax=Rhodothalassium salexigens DSM 2132 TaxID=1188247 RepID=A0A4V6NQT4_RHOSA|nr:hydroxyacylglutathione hydrolase [Rhodothalassium salexigens]MBB4211736.1 hydroxyacylglutathione hydrolase [Rhodothalassium salexigens DSM 2132]TCP33966.1 hydroxyacylglutathione hydrolase [Rhodothalassium salexigens DSM 2132]